MKLVPPYGSPALRAAQQELSERLTLETRRVQVLERLADQHDAKQHDKAAARTKAVSKEEPAKPLRPSQDFAARRAEIEAIVQNARLELAQELLALCESWNTPGLQHCRAAVHKLAARLREG
jgi:hypothetical protein